MKNRLFFLLLTLLLALTVIAHAQDDDDDDDVARPTRPAVMKPTEKPAGVSFACPYEKDFRQPHKYGAYTLRLLPEKKDKDDKDDKDQDGDPRCRAVLTVPGGRTLTIADEWALTVDKLSGSDLNGDGKNEVVLEGYSGGLHCCYTYLVISLSRTPKILHAFQNQVPMTFEKQADGTTLIHAADGVFDYFLVPHTNAVIPHLVLQMQGNDLLDVSAHFPELYDKEIEQARSELTPADLEKFRQSNYRDRLFMDQVLTVHRVLAIVLNYVYSGREEKAWQALNELWPASDVGRVKSLINERRKRGLLANLACDCRPAVATRRPLHEKRRPSPPDETTDQRIHDIIDD
jgi:hypothetical protein